MDSTRSSSKRQTGSAFGKADVEHPGGRPTGAAGRLFDRQASDGSFERLRAELLANISDQIRTPLKHLLDPLQELEDGICGELGARARQHVIEARCKAARVIDLIDHLVDASRLDAGAVELRAGFGDLSALLRSVVERMTSRAEHEGVDLRFEGPDGALELRFDPDLLVKAFSNLLAGALVVTPAGGRVRVTLLTAGDGTEPVTVRVSDEGPGMAPPGIFERAYGVADPSNPYAAGDGLGLSLARDLVGLHGGELTVESVEGVGSTFIVRLPPASRPRESRAPGIETRMPRVETVPADRAVPRPPALIEPPVGTVMGDAGEYAPLALVAGEPSDFLAVLCRHLSGRYRVAEVAGTARALERARELLPDVVISEVPPQDVEPGARLPGPTQESAAPRDALLEGGTDGRALCQEIKCDPELDFVPVILILPEAAPGLFPAGVGGGADSYLSSPVEVSELIVRIDALIAARRRVLEHFTGAGVPVTEPGGLPAAPGVGVTPEDGVFLEDVRQTVVGHMGDDEFEAGVLATSLAIDRAELERRLGRLTGFTPARLILEVRLKVAAHQLTDAGAPISEIAWMFGFGGLEHFNRCFQSRFRKTPAAFRARF